MNVLKNTTILVVALLLPVAGIAQKESDEVRTGNRHYNKKKYTEAEIEYRKALVKNNKSFEANYNLGNALFRQGKYNEAYQQYKTALPFAGDNKKKLASELHNMGNTLIGENKIQEAIDSYKMALKNNPADNDTRYNLAYAQMLLKKQQQENKDNKNNNKDKQNKDKDQQQQPKNEPDKEKKQEQPQPQQPQMSKENAQQILEALQQDEKDTQDKAKKAQVHGRKKADKDW